MPPREFSRGGPPTGPGPRRDGPDQSRSGRGPDERVIDQRNGASFGRNGDGRGRGPDYNPNFSGPNDRRPNGSRVGADQMDRNAPAAVSEAFTSQN